MDMLDVKGNGGLVEDLLDEHVVDAGFEAGTDFGVGLGGGEFLQGVEFGGGNSVEFLLGGLAGGEIAAAQVREDLASGCGDEAGGSAARTQPTKTVAKTAAQMAGWRSMVVLPERSSPLYNVPRVEKWRRGIRDGWSTEEADRGAIRWRGHVCAAGARWRPSEVPAGGFRSGSVWG